MNRLRTRASDTPLLICPLGEALRLALASRSLDDCLALFELLEHPSALGFPAETARVRDVAYLHGLGDVAAIAARGEIPGLEAAAADPRLSQEHREAMLHNLVTLSRIARRN